MIFGDVQARDALVTHIETLWAASPHKATPIYSDNGPAPQLNKLERFVKYEIHMVTSKQMTLGEEPIDRTFGYVQFYFGCREGTGTRQLLILRDFLKQELKAKVFGSLKTLIPSPDKKNTGNGWHFEALRVPFYFDGMPIAFSPSQTP